MNEYLQDLFSAFQLVDSRYYFTEVFRDIDNYHQEQEAVIQSTENSFSAELFQNFEFLCITRIEIRPRKANIYEALQREQFQATTRQHLYLHIRYLKRYFPLTISGAA